MPSLMQEPTVPLHRDPEYDVEAGVSIGFLNRVIATALSSGALPSSFTFTAALRDEQLGARVDYSLRIGIRTAALFSAPNEDRQIGIRLIYEGLVTVQVRLDEWTFAAPAGPHVEPELDEKFETPFEGEFEATAQMELAAIDGARLVRISFARLLRADLHHIGDLLIGADFNELVRRVCERVAIVRLRTTFVLPKLNGLSGSLPAPLQWLLNSASGQIGAVDLKVVGGAPATDPDEIHLLLQADQNMGQQSYSAVRAFTGDAFDIGAAVSLRWLRQIEQDFWIGELIPRRFNDQGVPDPGGKVAIMRLSATFFPRTLQVRCSIRREFIGLPVNLDATLEVRPFLQNGLLYVDLVNSDIDLNLAWARQTAWSLVFFVVRDLIGRLVLRAVDELIEPWTQTLLEQFVQGRGIDLRRRFDWPGTPFKIDLWPSVIDITPRRLLIGADLRLHA